MSIAEILLDKGLVTPDHLTEAMELRSSDGLRLDKGQKVINLKREKGGRIYGGKRSCRNIGGSDRCSLARRRIVS